MTATPWLTVLDDTARACSTQGRADLAHRLLRRRAQVLDGGLRVVVIGLPNQGKSQLVNALVTAQICAVGDDRTTEVAAVVKHAETATGRLVTDDVPAIGQGTAPESLTAAANKLSLRPDDTTTHAEVGLPRSLLAAGIVLVDTPGIRDPHDPTTARALAVLPEADAVLLVSDATGELSAAELDLLHQVVKVCPAVVVVLTKIDLVPSWRRVAERDKGLLAGAGLPATVVPVSADLRLAAAKTGDRALNQESGFGDLVDRLRRDLLAGADVLVGRSVAASTKLAIDALIAPLREEFTELGRAPAEDPRMRTAGQRLADLRRETGRWQTVLADDVGDLMSDVEHDLRERTRRMLREVDDYFELADPLKVWTEFEEWMREELTAIAETNSAWLIARFEWIAAKVAQAVDPDGPGLPELPGEMVPDLRMPRIEKFTPVQKLFVGIRGSYSGLLMSGLATTLAGMPLINPISIGAGAAFGARSVFEERGSRLKRRQAIAKTAAQRHVDDFFLAFGKQSRDATRMIHRTLRDRFTELAERLQAEATEKVTALRRTADEDTARRTRRQAEIHSDMTKLARLRQQLDAVAAAPLRPRGLTA